MVFLSLFPARQKTDRLLVDEPGGNSPAKHRDTLISTLGGFVKRECSPMRHVQAIFPMDGAKSDIPNADGWIGHAERGLHCTA